jgi:glycosyltransferase involved in cell wall biosynthesis
MSVETNQPYLPENYDENNINITFIIPSIGRSSLINTIASLINQTNPNWKAIVVFDGIERTIQIKDPRIKCIEILKSGKERNIAANVRNEGIRWATTEWIGLVDDDDIVSSRYVETFINEINNYPQMDAVIFRMYQEKENGNIIDRVLPELNTNSLYHEHVGISFVFKRQIFHLPSHAAEVWSSSTIRSSESLKPQIYFIESDAEDFIFLENIIQNNYNVMISPYIRYFVRNVLDGTAYIDYDKFTNDEIIGNRVFFSNNFQHL